MERDLERHHSYLFADQVDASRTQRPFLICNMGMFVTMKNVLPWLLVPGRAVRR